MRRTVGTTSSVLGSRASAGGDSKAVVIARLVGSSARRHRCLRVRPRSVGTHNARGVALLRHRPSSLRRWLWPASGYGAAKVGTGMLPVRVVLFANTRRTRSSLVAVTEPRRACWNAAVRSAPRARIKSRFSFPIPMRAGLATVSLQAPREGSTDLGQAADPTKPNRSKGRTSGLPRAEWPWIIRWRRRWCCCGRRRMGSRLVRRGFGLGMGSGRWRLGIGR